jgi:hypothetical protein
MIWQEERSNSSENFWQEFFESHPEALLPALSGRAFSLGSKCYVGGKNLSNSGGNVVDFILQHKGDVTIVEIKTPTASLVGAEYRTSVHPPSRELTGSVIQVLNYRAHLLKNLHALKAENIDLQVVAPRTLVIIGDSERFASEAELQSFLLFRGTLGDTTVLTYDEVFDGIAQLCVAIEALSDGAS